MCLCLLQPKSKITPVEGSVSDSNLNLKIVFLGCSAVGAKTSFIQRYTTGNFPEMGYPTVGAYTKKVVISRGKTVNLEMWDTAGQERFLSLTPMYLRGCDGIVVGYDVTCRSSLEEARARYSRLKEEYPSAVIMVLGNKVDVPIGNDRVSSAEGETFANGIRASLFFESKGLQLCVHTLFIFLFCCSLCKNWAQCERVNECVC